MSVYFETAPDTTLHIRITQPDTSTTKPLLVFLHYWGGSSATWHKVTSTSSLTSLSSQYPTVAIDLRGWGSSTGPSEDTGRSYAVVNMAADVASVLSQLKDDAQYRGLLTHGFVLVGHSMGGKVAVATLSTLPTNLLKLLRGFVLVAPAPPTTLVLPPDMKEQQKVAYESADSVRWTVTNVLADVQNLDHDDVELIVRDSLRGTRLAKEAWPAYGMEQDISHDVKVALGPLARRIKVRILTGELDVVEPRERVQTQVCRFLEDAGVEVSFRAVPGVRHLIPLEGPAAIVEEIFHF